jgi:hypothetical protein
VNIAAPRSGEGVRMTNRRRIVFHIGGPKTGSSALQLCLQSNAEALRERGIDYASSPEPAVATDWARPGNGGKLHSLLMSPEPTDELVDRTLSGYLDTGHTGICSSELLGQATERAWAAVGESCHRLDVRPEFVMFVRDVYPYCYSTYHQAVKRAGELCSFPEFVFRPWHWHATALRRLSRVFGNENLHVLHYDSHAEDIEEAFFEAVGIEHEELSKLPRSYKVNRRMSRGELDVLVLANRYLRPADSHRLLEMMLYSQDAGAPIPPPSGEILDAIKRRFGADVAWVNDEFFGSKLVVTLSGGYGVIEQTPQQLLDSSSAEARALAWAFREIAELNDKVNRDLATRLGGLVQDIRDLCSDQTFAKHPQIPPDFNPFMYLICNPDVVVARVSPYEHYIRWGRNESRAWRLD